MTKEQREDLLNDFKETAQAKAVADYLMEEIDKLDSVRGIGSIEETIGRQRAIETLNRIIKNITPQEESFRKKNQYK